MKRFVDLAQRVVFQENWPLTNPKKTLGEALLSIPRNDHDVSCCCWLGKATHSETCKIHGKVAFTANYSEIRNSGQ